MTGHRRNAPPEKCLSRQARVMRASRFAVDVDGPNSIPALEFIAADVDERDCEEISSQFVSVDPPLLSD